MNTITTTLRLYRFDVREPDEARACAELFERLRQTHPHCMDSWGPGAFRAPNAAEINYHKALAALDGRQIELETKHLFSDQWNTAPVEGVTESGLRVFDWKRDRWENKSLITGHYLEQTEEMRELRRNTNACGFCGHQEAAQRGAVFCGQCLDSEYLKADELHRLRMLPAEEFMPERAPLTEAERAHLLPLYREAQLHGTTERGRKRIAAQRERIERDYKRAIYAAKTEHDGLLWLLDHGITASVIYYKHADLFGFGWDRPVPPELESELLDLLTEFPHEYQIKTSDGRTIATKEAKA